MGDRTKRNGKPERQWNRGKMWESEAMASNKQEDQQQKNLYNKIANRRGSSFPFAVSTSLHEQGIAHLMSCFRAFDDPMLLVLVGAIR
jgi:hypothetical protein